jgi:hypothetical protein
MKRTSIYARLDFFFSFSCAATIERRGKQGEAIELCVGWQSFDEPANDARAFIEERGVSTEAATQDQGDKHDEWKGASHCTTDHMRQLESDSQLQVTFCPLSTPR